MLVLYKHFSESEHWGDATVFSNIIEETFTQIFNKRESFEVSSLENALDENYFNLDEFEHPLASYAFDACQAFDEMLQFLKSGENIHMLNNAQVCINTVDMFIQQKENIQVVYDVQELEEMIPNDKFMINEKNRQLTLLEELNKLKDINNESIKN